jgi:hypothetical protein
MLVWMPPPPLAYESTPSEEIRRGARRGPVLDLRMPPAQDLQELPCTPIGVRAAELAEQLREHRADLVRTGVRCPASIRQPALAFLGEAREPLVADPPAHAVALAQLGHREAITLGVQQELQSLVHGNGLQSSHGVPRGQERRGAV